MKRTRLDIRDWEAFACLVALRHFGRAADELGVTQSAISQRIAKLEADLDLKVLHRSNMGVEPTDAGRALLPHAKALLAAKRNALEAASALKKHGSRPVRMILSNAIAHTALLLQLRRALEQGDGMGFEVDVETADEIETKLLNREYDFAITTLPVSRDGLQQELMTKLPMGVAVPSEGGFDRVSVSDLCKNPLLTMPRATEPELFDALIVAATHAGQTLQIARSVVSFPSILAMVALGKGWGIVPLMMAGAAPAGVKVVPFAATQPSLVRDPAHIKVWTAWRSDNGLAKQMISVLKGIVWDVH